ncbi:hypothetical protein M2132_001377 [Dysgonomonas sp. PH5-45]|uniref:porin family protein n=1 Tax=unclassified Dysgonomonas TaxID=2630389 RepID=UPI002473BE10|nr:MULTISPECIES: porin family protein [unclassified Dysgonomonas]MDH6355040.1 hypothetical protein [Dysgonomonas sp. PH5-45]MDH6387940.1 hypothetical protein [Dysgonomonas sp. PH5-37]
MTRKIIYAFFFIIAALNLNAQDNAFKPEWNFGVGFGPTFSTVDTDPKLKTKYTMGFHGGLSARYIAEKYVGVLAELNYSRLGWETDFKDNPGGYEHSHRLNYLELPFMTHITIGDKVRFVINIGPKIGLLLSEKETMNDNLKKLLVSEDIPANMITYQYYRDADIKFDYGLIAGLGVEFRTGVGNFMFEGRYAFSLGDIYHNSKSDYFTRSANRVAYARLTYFIKPF